MRRTLPLLMLLAALAIACGDGHDDEVNAEPTPSPEPTAVRLCAQPGRTYHSVGLAPDLCCDGSAPTYIYMRQATITDCPIS